LPAYRPVPPQFHPLPEGGSGLLASSVQLMIDLITRPCVS
jgi:hypothetical protein